MQRFHSILFVSPGVKDETEALQLALKLASNNEAQLRIFNTCPTFPDTLSEYKTSDEESLINKMNKAIQLAKSGAMLKWIMALHPINLTTCQRMIR
ncbi:hypothetical protein [Legionella bozemanae]|uniref:Universal stress protein family protein n=1 Tax=Legionella bozemanae TaxID=447 RepID=A0A0W0RQ51_LEGBO|nr:hypothetical protein [Legionella bozemanae]KTC73177.1 hypothetical protein Lboz_1823 [Legionella bozemanae]STP14121.1 Uncharacterised protein [Legionella bozemanae]